MKTEPKRKSSKELFMKRYNLTPSQKNIDELQKFYKNTSISVLCGAVIFEKKLEKEFLMRAVSILIRKHEALRHRFCRERKNSAVCS